MPDRQPGGSDRKVGSVPTRGRTLDHAAAVYDLVEPVILLGKQAAYDAGIVELLQLEPEHKVLDVGCGTGVLTRAVADRLDPDAGGYCLGIDAAGKMIRVARKRRSSLACRFEAAAAEDLPLEDAMFDAVVSSLFFHHVDLELKRRSLAEAFRVLKPGGRLVVADMHTPTTVFGRLISHTARWFFMQPEIAENIQGVLPRVMESVGFSTPRLAAVHFGYIATFVSEKPQGSEG